MVASLALFASAAHAGNEANFVLYSHHTEPAGETEINIYNDASSGVGDLRRYNAQMIEVEHAFTDRLVMSLYFDGEKTPGEDYRFGGWKFETRYRLFDHGAVFLNPVLYVE